VQEAVNGLRLGGWEVARVLLGLTRDDAGTLVERVLARVVTDTAVRQWNAAHKPD
jgi:hypothetical protein